MLRCWRSKTSFEGGRNSVDLAIGELFKDIKWEDHFACEQLIEGWISVVQGKSGSKKVNDHRGTEAEFWHIRVVANHSNILVKELQKITHLITCVNPTLL